MAAVALLASAATAIVTRSQTIAAVEDAASIEFENETTIRDAILFHGMLQGTWDALDPLVDELAAELDTRIAVTRIDGRVLADSDPEAPLPDDARATLDVRFDFPSTEVELGDAVTLTADPFEVQLIECLDGRGLDVEVLEDLDFFEGDLVLDDDELDDLDACFNEAEEDLATLVAPPVDLFIGYPAEALIDLGSLDFGQVAIAALGVLALGLVLSFFVAGRVSRPVGQLTEAVDMVAAGDLSQRVPSDGDGEFGRLATAFNSMAARLELGEQARTRMVSDIAHELRNPIGVLQGNLEAAQDGVFEVDRELIDTLHFETVHLSHLVEDLQQLALADAGALAVELQPTDLEELVAGVVAGHRHAADESGIELDTALAPVIATVDPKRIRQVVTNLLANAIAYTQPGGRVDVRLRSTDEGVALAVVDTGVGLTPEEQQRVFDRFWRADASRDRRTGGRGVGLSVCKELVIAHGGTIEVVSAPGEGSTFTVLLPRE